MKTIEERAKYAGIVCQYKSDYRYDPRSVESGYMQGATEQKAIDDERIAELEKEKALLILEVHNKNKRIAELKAMEE